MEGAGGGANPTHRELAGPSEGDQPVNKNKNRNSFILDFDRSKTEASVRVLLTRLIQYAWISSTIFSLVCSVRYSGLFGSLIGSPAGSSRQKSRQGGWRDHGEVSSSWTKFTAIDELEHMRSYVVHTTERDFLLGVGSTMLLARILSTMSPLTAFEIQMVRLRYLLLHKHF